jgi:hypothetical protein
MTQLLLIIGLHYVIIEHVNKIFLVIKELLDFKIIIYKWQVKHN